MLQIDKDGCWDLRDHMQEIYDFVKLTEKAWDTLAEWYGYDFEIKIK